MPYEWQSTCFMKKYPLTGVPKKLVIIKFVKFTDSQVNTCYRKLLMDFIVLGIFLWNL